MEDWYLRCPGTGLFNNTCQYTTCDWKIITSQNELMFYATKKVCMKRQKDVTFKCKTMSNERMDYYQMEDFTLLEVLLANTARRL